MVALRIALSLDSARRAFEKTRAGKGVAPSVGVVADTTRFFIPRAIALLVARRTRINECLSAGRWNVEQVALQEVPQRKGLTRERRRAEGSTGRRGAQHHILLILDWITMADTDALAARRRDTQTPMEDNGLVAYISIAARPDILRPVDRPFVAAVYRSTHPRMVAQ